MSNNLNLEFRKIPSLQFLYEVNSNGTIFRNVKSKKQLKIKIDYHHSPKGYWHTFVNIKGKCIRVMLHKVVAECWLGPKPEGLQVDHINRNSLDNDYRNLRYVTHSEQMKNRTLSPEYVARIKANCAPNIAALSKPCKVNGQYFKSLSQAANFIGSKEGKTMSTVMKYLKQRRAQVYGYSMEYLRNAETRHTHSTE